jgi:hypothetical protein
LDGVRRELESIRLLLGSKSETRGVDAYCLAIIKVERQARRLATVFVRACIDPIDNVKRHQIDESLSNRLYFKHLVALFNSLSTTNMQALAGRTSWSADRAMLEDAHDHRNRLFHGCRTGAKLNQGQLYEKVEALCGFVQRVGTSAHALVGFDGCYDTWSADLSRVRTARINPPPFLNVGELAGYLNELKKASKPTGPDLPQA